MSTKQVAVPTSFGRQPVASKTPRVASVAVAAHTMTVNNHPEANGTSWWAYSAKAPMLPQLPCPNGSHHPNRSATADRKAAASDSRSAIRTTRIGSAVCMHSSCCVRIAEIGQCLQFVDVERCQHFSSLTGRLIVHGVVGGE